MVQKITTVTIDPKTGDITVDNVGYVGTECSKIVEALARGNTVTKDVHKPEYKLANQNGTAVSR